MLQVAANTPRLPSTRQQIIRKEEARRNRLVRYLNRGAGRANLSGWHRGGILVRSVSSGRGTDQTGGVGQRGRIIGAAIDEGGRGRVGGGGREARRGAATVEREESYEGRWRVKRKEKGVASRLARGQPHLRRAAGWKAGQKVEDSTPRPSPRLGCRGKTAVLSRDGCGRPENSAALAVRVGPRDRSIRMDLDVCISYF
jgi:hypothetical protein